MTSDKPLQPPPNPPAPIFTDWRLFLATCAGAGLAPRAPGTVGTLAAVPFYFAALAALPLPALAALAALLLAAGIPLCSSAERRLARPDDKRIVWDEFAVFYTVLVLLPPLQLAGAHWQLAAFILFRLLDALKPFPIGWLDKHLHGGSGIMADDIAAGFFTLLFLYAAALIL